NLRNWFAGQEFTKTVNFIDKKGGKFDGVWVTSGRYEGGLIDFARTVPGRKAGGWVPGERAGYDNVLWPLHSGGQVLAQPLEGREFVVNSRDAARYPAELNAMNNGTYPTGTLERAYSAASGATTIIQQGASGPVELSAGSVQALARAVQPYLVVKDQVIAQANGADA